MIRTSGRKGKKHMKKVVMFCALLALTSMIAFGAAIDGKWTAETQGRNGPQTQTLMLKADGMKLTGNLDGGRGGPVEIKEGKMDGMNVSFKVTRAGRDGADQTITYTGMLMGDDLKLTATGGRGPQELPFKRAK